MILAGRVSRSERAWETRIALAERLNARVITDLKVATAFPTGHPLHAGDLRGKAGPSAQAALVSADAIIALDWVDLSGALKTVFGDAEPACPVIRATTDHHLHNGWSMDHQAHPLADIMVACDPDGFAKALLARLGGEAQARYRPSPSRPRRCRMTAARWQSLKSPGPSKTRWETRPQRSPM